MNVISTRGGDRCSVVDALQRGLARDGGLYVPEHWLRFLVADFDGRDALAEVAAVLLRPFLADSPLADQVDAICAEALDFDTPLATLNDGRTHLLELFHGPTGAFKDVGARVLAACLSRLRAPGAPDLTVLVATSGDTGSAVAGAFHRRAGFKAVVLFPARGVSPRQKHLLSCFGDNVRSFAVDGTFDDCQTMVKAAFANAELQAAVPLTSANSISIGRLLPQMAYYAQASLRHARRGGKPLNFAIPSGNLGNALASIWVRAMGLPIGDIAIVSNANRVLPDFFETHDYRPRPSIATIANAMDVGAPSNLERLRAGFAETGGLHAMSVSDDRIRERIPAFLAEFGAILCPHTATAAEFVARRRAAGDARDWVIVATAHPAKFETVVEPLIGRSVAVPPTLSRWLDSPSRAEPLPASAEALATALRGG
jgi:threonine synthase